MGDINILLFTLAIEKNTGNFINISNLDMQDLPYLYRALTTITAKIFEDITANQSKENVDASDKV